MEVLTWLQIARATAAAAVPSCLAGRLFAALRWARKRGMAAIHVARRFAVGRPRTRLRVERVQRGDGIAVVRLDWSYGGDDPSVVEGALSLLTALASSEAVTSSGRRRQKHRRKGPRRSA